MAQNRYLMVLLSVAVTLGFVKCDHDVAECPNGYEHGQYLDEDTHRYLLCWKVNWSDHSITFTAKVATIGWVGLGFSPTGLMPNSDVVIGWVKNNRGYLKDCFATTKSRLQIDTVQNVALLSSSEANGWTTLELKRNLTACESNDRNIEMGTTRVIYSYNSNDPASEDSIQEYTVSGGARINFLSGTGNVQPGPLESDHQTYDLKNSAIKVPAKPTTYWCTPFKLPTVEKESHIIKIKPIIEPKHNDLVRKILLLDCSDILKDYLTLSWNCEEPPDEQLGIYSEVCAVVSVWATGGKGLSFPADVGLPMGGATGTKYVLMQTHYDNPEVKSNYVDSSGIKLYYTPTKRKYDGAILSVGQVVDYKKYPYTVPFFLPPQRKDMALVNLCPGDCTSLGLPQDGIHVFASMLHARFAGNRVKVKHIRDKTELPDIDRNDNYDFELQDTVLLPNEVKVLPGDDIEVLCNYDTTNRSSVTLGGLGTNDEICLAYLLVYPRPPLSNCWSQSPNTQLLYYLNLAARAGWYTNYVNNSAGIDTQYAQLSRGLKSLRFESDRAYEQWNKDYWSSTTREYKCLGLHLGSLLAEDSGLTKLPNVPGRLDAGVRTPEPCFGIVGTSRVTTPPTVSTGVTSTGTPPNQLTSAASFVFRSLWLSVGCAALNVMLK